MSPELERLIGKAVIDREFRQKLLDSPDEAIKAAGITLSPDELDKVREAAKQRTKDIVATNQALDAVAQGEWA